MPPAPFRFDFAKFLLFSLEVFPGQDRLARLLEAENSAPTMIIDNLEGRTRLQNNPVPDPRTLLRAGV